MFKLINAALLFFSLHATVAFADSRLEMLVTNLLPSGAQWSLVVVDLETGREVTAAGTQKGALVPASLVKLFTAGALLDHAERQGVPDLRTLLVHDGTVKNGILDGNLYLVGKGNALLTLSDLKRAARSMADAGIVRIVGDIIADETAFDHKGLTRSRKGPGYAPAGALGIDLHTVALTIVPTEAGHPPQIMISPPNEQVRFAVAARTAVSSESSLEVIQLGDMSYRATGNLPVDTGTRQWRFSLQEPALYAAGAFKTQLMLSHVEVQGKARIGKAPDGLSPIVALDAPPLEKLVSEMNRHSLNVVADNLLLLLGAERFGVPGTRLKGLAALNEFLASLKINKEEAVLVDGSGLSDENKITAACLAHYLRNVTKKTWFPAFRDSLPRSGMEGTVQGSTFKDERFRVKSGRLENTFSLAGYGVDWRNENIAFAFIVNVPGAAFVDLERSGAEVMRYLAREVLR